MPLLTLADAEAGAVGRAGGEGTPGAWGPLGAWGQVPNFAVARFWDLTPNSSGLRLPDDPEPVLPADLPRVLRRGHAPDRRKDLGVAAGVLRHGAAPAHHVQADRDVVGAYGLDHIVDLLGPLVRGGDERLRLGIFAPLAERHPVLMEFMVHLFDVLAVVARRAGDGGLVPDHLEHRLARVGRLVGVVRQPFAVAPADDGRAAMDADQAALRRE